MSTTETDDYRCSAAATLSAYLILGGDFNTITDKLYLPSNERTYEIIHLAQEAIYNKANVDGEHGIYGTTKAHYDDQGQLIDWSFRAEDEYHTVIEILDLKVERIFSKIESTPMDKKAEIDRVMDHPQEGVISTPFVLNNPLASGLAKAILRWVNLSNSISSMRLKR